MVGIEVCKVEVVQIERVTRVHKSVAVLEIRDGVLTVARTVEKDVATNTAVKGTRMSIRLSRKAASYC